MSKNAWLLHIIKAHHSSKSNLTRPILKHPLRLLVQREMEKDVSKLYSSFIILVLISKEKNTGDHCALA